MMVGPLNCGERVRDRVVRGTVTRLLLTLLCGAVISSVLASTYDELRAAAVKKCEAIDPSAYRSGLAFNPDGYRSFYVRSQCFQRAAVEFRDEALCGQARQRRSLFSSSWGISPRQCRQLVAAGLEKDRHELEATKALFVKGGMRLRDFRIERNGNGRDFDIIPVFTGSYAHGYTLRFEILGKGRSPALLHANGYYVDGTGQLRLFVRQSEVRQRMPEFTLDRLYTVRATAVLSVPSGSAGARWSDAFVERIFPTGERSSSVTKEIQF